MVVRRVSQQLDEGTEPLENEREAPAQDDRDEDLELEADDADPEDEDDDESPEGVEDDELPDGDEPSDEPVRQARRPGGRGDRQFGSLREREREARERARQLEHELALERAQRQTPQRQESPAVRQARLAAMSDQERTEFLINEVRQEGAQQREIDRFNAADSADRARFDGIAQSKPQYKKYAAEVERRLQLARANGQNVPRETILTFLLGERVRTGLDSPQVQRQRTQARDRVAREKASLPRGRGERGSSRTETERAARERRLENVQI